MRTALAAMTCVAVFGVSTAWARDRSSASVETRRTHVYTCPQHPEIKATWPGRCPRCGAQLREKGRPTYRGEEAGHQEGRSRPTVVRRETAGPYYSPEALLRARQRLNLSDRQMRELREIEMVARRRAWSVLTEAQIARLRSYTRARATNREGNALRDRLRDQYRDWYRDRARDWDRDQARDRWHDGQRWNNWSDPYGSLYDYGPTAYGFDYGLRPRVELTEEDEDEGFGDEGFGDEGFGDEGFGDEGFGEGFGGEEGFGNEGFGGEEGFGNEGFRGEEGFGNEGFGGERFGGERFGNEGSRGEQGFGNEGFGGERSGGERFGNEGSRGEQGFGNEGFGGERSGGERFGNEGSRGEEGFGGERFGGGEMGGARESGGEARDQ
jgi:hypothetical protein